MDKSEIIKKYFHDIDRLKGKTIGLKGALGSGKTRFVKHVLKTISQELCEQVISPTFNLCCVYTLNTVEIHHFDLYRVETEEELYDIDIYSSINNSRAIVFIEWIDQFPILLNSCDYVVSISVNTDERRDYAIELNPSLNKR